MNIKREATAISRTNISVPTRMAIEKKFVKSVVYDWGCGKGKDTQLLNDMGIPTIGYDPHYFPGTSPDKIDFSDINTILLNYVLNVIETRQERFEVLEQIHSFAQENTNVVIAVRSKKDVDREALKNNWIEYGDGFITKKQTFQKGYTNDELARVCSFMGATHGVYPISSGIVCVVKIIKTTD